MNQSTQHVNSKIRCSVESCSYHTSNYCTLDSISVGCSDAKVTASKDTECNSFRKGQ
ncbi:MAG: DUF1540 domain-containing protein [Oscillospiraceae bacterium]|nr:DUF1540 domain-containing protein [Oscillospiraceae bacterium]